MVGYFRNRELQFSLGSFLILLTAVALLGAWYRNHQAALEREDAVLRIITNKGGAVRRDFWGGVDVDFTTPREEIPPPGPNPIPLVVHRPFHDSDLPLLERIIKLDVIDFHCSFVTARAAREFQQSHQTCLVVHPEFAPQD
jgi:hypothetical protein